MSDTSQRSSPITCLYRATGDGAEADDLSVRSAVSESGDELINRTWGLGEIQTQVDLITDSIAITETFINRLFHSVLVIIIQYNICAH